MSDELWMYSKDQENYFGGDGTKADAINAGRADYVDGDPFVVARVQKREYSTDLFDDISWKFDDANCDESGEDYASNKWGKGEQKEIAAILAATFRDWLRPKGYLQAWSLDVFEEEEVPATEAFHIWEETGEWPAPTTEGISHD